MLFNNYFFKHPKSVCMTYIEHFKFSFFLSYMLALGSFKALIHAILPDFYITSSSDLVEELKFKIENSGCKK